LVVISINSFLNKVRQSWRQERERDEHVII
jgi:hypothetical protein